MRHLLQITTWFMLAGLILSACAPVVRPDNDVPIPESMPQTTTREAQVQGVDIEVMDTNPLQVNAVVRGNLSESCATLAPSQVSYASHVFEIKVHAVSPADLGCAQVTVPFETTVALDTQNLSAGTYTVRANGVSAVFTLPSGHPTPITTRADTPAVVPTRRGCSDAAAFVSDVTMPDNILIAPGTEFTKTWRLKNVGTCTWDRNYLVHWMSGTTMTQQPGYWIVGPEERVESGQTVDISVGMTAPMQNGSYTSYWGLKGRNGQFMPIQHGANGNAFYVKIKVNDGSIPPGNITAASIDVELEQGSSAACTPGATYLVHAYLTADGPTTARYEIDSSAGQIPAGYFVGENSNDLHPYVTGIATFDPELFDEGGTRTIILPYRFVGPYPYPHDITVLLRVNDGAWHDAKLSCQG